MGTADVLVVDADQPGTTVDRIPVKFSDYKQLVRKLDRYCTESSLTFRKLLLNDGTRVFDDSDLPEDSNVQLVLHVKNQTAGPSIALGSTSLPRNLAAGPVQQFWARLSQAKLEDNLLTLVAGTFFLGDCYAGSTLYVRRCYTILLQKLRQYFSTGGARFVITGNPGIGKSMLAYYLLYQLSLERVTVVWQSRQLKKRLLLRPDQDVLRGSLDDFDDYLYKSATWYLVDGMEPAGCPAKTVLVSSPHRPTYKEFLKMPHATIRYMPVWREEELKVLRSAVYHTMAVDDMSKLYDRWGGIPRYVLEKATDDAAQALLDRAIATCDAASIISSVGELDTAPEASHRILHFDVEDDMLTCNIKFASQWVADSVAAKLCDQQSLDLRAFLLTSADQPELGVVRGQLWEPYAHRVLASGGSFKVRDLNTGLETTLSLPRAQTYAFTDLALVKSQPGGVYCKPVSKRLAAIDALEQDHMLFQITTNLKHGIDGSGLGKALQYMNAPETDCALYFVVPFDKFPAYGKQTMKKPKEGEGPVPYIKQLVLAIPIEVT